MIKTPWTQEHVDKLNKYQNNSPFHPYTCGVGNGENPKCERQKIPMDFGKDGKLIATKDGWICPCGEYKQDWSY